MRVIDVHVHLVRDGSWFQTHHDASLECFSSQAQRAGIVGSILLPAVGVPDTYVYAKELRANSPDHFRVAWGATDQTLRVASVPWDEIDAIKISPRHLRSDIRSDAMIELLREAAKRSKPVFFCTLMQSNLRPLQSLHPYNYDVLAKACPETTIILCHAGWPHLQEAVMVARSNVNVFLDVSFFVFYAPFLSIVRDFFATLHRVDQKVLFGSDFPECPIDPYLDEVIRLFDEVKLPQDKRNNILYRNAARLFGFPL